MRPTDDLDENVHGMRLRVIERVRVAQRTVTRRPTPGQVAAIAGDLHAVGAVVTVPLLVAALRRDTGCSRATAYRAVVDAFNAGEIESADG